MLTTASLGAAQGTIPPGKCLVVQLDREFRGIQPVVYTTGENLFLTLKITSMTKLINTEVVVRISLHYIAQIDVYELTIKRGKEKMITTVTEGEAMLIKQNYSLEITEE
jgi:hypothetical protein